jgi:predicted DNA-binding protein with PD1-like motif
VCAMGAETEVAELAGQFGRVIFTRLEPGADPYLEIVETCKRQRIRTGVILSMTGGFDRTRLSMPYPPPGLPEDTPRIVEREGVVEVQGTGVIGHTYDDWEARNAGAHWRAGDPYVHLHVAVSWLVPEGAPGNTMVGHLIEGCRVFSLHPLSHFTMVIAEVTGVELGLRLDGSSPHGFHTLRAIPDQARSPA